MKNNIEYELMYITSIDNNESLDSLRKTVKEIIVKEEGSIIRESEPQKRKLAYPIKKIKNGIYLINRIMVDKDKIKEIDNKLKLEAKIIRHLIVRVDDLPEKERELEPKTEPRKDSSPGVPEKENLPENPKKQTEDSELKKEKEIAKKFADLKEEEPVEEKPKKEKQKLKFEDLEKKLDDILKDDLI